VVTDLATAYTETALREIPEGRFCW